MSDLAYIEECEYDTLSWEVRVASHNPLAKFCSASHSKILYALRSSSCSSFWSMISATEALHMLLRPLSSCIMHIGTSGLRRWVVYQTMRAAHSSSVTRRCHPRTVHILTFLN